MLALLLRQRLWLLRNRLFRGGNRVLRSLRLLFTVGVAGGFLLLTGLNMAAVVERLAAVDRLAAEVLLPFLLASLTALALVTSLATAFHHLFLSADLELLLAAPVPRRDLFGLKLLETWRDAGYVLLFELAALVGYLEALGFPVVSIGLAVLSVILLTLGASAVGVIVTVLLARLAFGSSLLGFARLLAVVLFAPAVGLVGAPIGRLGLGGRPDGLAGGVGLNQARAMASALRELGPAPAWAPTTWVADILLGRGGLPLLVWLVAVSVGLLVVAAIVFERLFPGSWERVHFADQPRRERRRRQRWLLAPLGGPVAAIIQKDWRTLGRDPRWRTSTVVSLAIAVLPLFAIGSGGPSVRGTADLSFWLSLFPLPYLAFILGSQQGAASLAYEGRNLMLLRAAPIDLQRVAVAKLAGGVTVVVGLSWLMTLLVGIWRGGGPVQIVAALLVMAWLGAGSTAAALAATGLTIDLEADNPQRRAGCLGTIATSALSTFFLASNTLLLGWWLLRAMLRLPRGLAGFVPVIEVLLVGLAIASAAAIGVAGYLAVRRLARWEGS